MDFFPGPADVIGVSLVGSQDGSALAHGRLLHESTGAELDADFVPSEPDVHMGGLEG